jgi:(4-(4-[2-(gamma-L-glutamylamino)ethyl]phenoxymethyl)furan-2-yl)methanamine synthase
MAHVILGLDIGGANLKAATPDKRAVSVPFPLWKQPEKLPAALADLIAQFGEVNEFAVTMTGELCDCFETKQQGVTAIVNTVLNVARSWPVRFWCTDGTFLNSNEAKEQWPKVAAANWHALARYVGDLNRQGTTLLIDIGSTTTDIIPILDGHPWTVGKCDTTRMENGELVYSGVKRTPLCALLPIGSVAAELFATIHDAYLLLGRIPEDPIGTDTADNRPEMKRFAHARIARMIGGDGTTVSEAETLRLASLATNTQFQLLQSAVQRQVRRLFTLQYESLGTRRIAVLSGSGEFLARQLIDTVRGNFHDILSLSDRLGPAVAECAPAFAVAVLAQERPL